MAPCHPLVTFLTPRSPSRAAFPTSYQETPKTTALYSLREWDDDASWRFSRNGSPTIIVAAKTIKIRRLNVLPPLYRGYLIILHRNDHAAVTGKSQFSHDRETARLLHSRALTRPVDREEEGEGRPGARSALDMDCAPMKFENLF
jgi:hypothetical protein